MRDDQIAGVDAGRIGDRLVWVMACSATHAGSEVRFTVYRAFRDLWQYARDSKLLVVAIDMPLGLPSEHGWRECEEEARQLLGPDRRDTVFMSPPLWLMDDRDPERERSWGRGVTRGQARENPRRLLDRCREVREVLDPGTLDRQARPRAAEVHAEVCFWKLNDSRPTQFEKRKQEGHEERQELLSREFAGVAEARDEVKRLHQTLHDYDLWDAAAAAWTARRIASNAAEILGSDEQDGTGYPLSIWI